jgi:hypothetical protein
MLLTKGRITQGLIAMLSNGRLGAAVLINFPFLATWLPTILFR